MTAMMTYLDEYLDPLTAAFTPEVAASIAQMRASPHLQSRIDELAAKANEGTLSPAEDAEYKARIEAIDILSIFQAKARQFLHHRMRQNGCGNT